MAERLRGYCIKTNNNRPNTANKQQTVEILIMYVEVGSLWTRGHCCPATLPSNMQTSVQEDKWRTSFCSVERCGLGLRIICAWVVIHRRGIIHLSESEWIGFFFVFFSFKNAHIISLKLRRKKNAIKRIRFYVYSKIRPLINTLELSIAHEIEPDISYTKSQHSTLLHHLPIALLASAATDCE